MKRYPPLSLDFITSRLCVNVLTGRVFWIDATKHHASLNGKEAGSPRESRAGKHYWRIKLNGIPYLRSHIVFTVANGRWPTLQVDHASGDSLDDRAANLREATQTQNAWNHKGRSKVSPMPMGVRGLGSKFQARIAVHKVMHYLGTYTTAAAAAAAYRAARQKHFGEFA